MLQMLISRGGRIIAPARCREYLDLCTSCQQVQEGVLFDKLRLYGGSKFGRDHAFDRIKTIADFKRQVPLGDHETHRAYVEQVMAGDIEAMFHPDEKIHAFHLSNGTTSRPRYVPVTGDFMRLHEQVWRTFHYHNFMSNPGIMDGKIFPFYSATIETHTAQGVPCGSDSGVFAEHRSPLLSNFYAVPGEAYQINNLAGMYYGLTRFALVENVSFMIGANPIIFLYFARAVDERKEAFIREIHDGTIDPEVTMPARTRKALTSIAHQRRNPARARKLEEIVRRTGRLLPRDYWPDLASIATWKGGTMFMPLELFPEYFGETPVRDLGLHSAEGRFTITLEDSGSHGVLAVTNNFYEFMPEEERGSANPDTLLAHELEIGKRYILIVSTSSGFYRYDMDDLIEVVGWHGQAPVIRFLSKARNIFDLAGHKMYEVSLVEAVRDASRRRGAFLQYFRMHPGQSNSGRPRLEAIYEVDDLPHSEDWFEFSQDVDQILANLDRGYGRLRAEGRIAPMVYRLIPGGTFEEKRMKLAEEGGIRLVEQLKHDYYVNDPCAHESHEILEHAFSH